MINSKSKDVVGIIPARMASSRFYGKPLAKILGKEMLLWVVEHSKESRLLSDVIVATDHEEIRSLCRSKNIKCIMTSSDHRSCCDRTNEACRNIKGEYVLEIQGDEPTLMAQDMDMFIEKSLEANSRISILYTDLPSERVNDPNFVKLVVDKESKALFFSRSAIPNNFKSATVSYFRQIGLYFWSAEFLKIFSETPVGPLEKIEDTQVCRLIENRYETLMVYTPNDTICVDLPEDIRKAESFLEQIPI